MKHELRIGLIGAGYMGKAHTLAFQSVAAAFDTPMRPVCEMIATSTAAGAAEVAARWGWARSTGDWKQLVDDPRVDAVVIATPPRTHLPMVLACIAAGKPVFCEKPLGATAEESLVMAKAVEIARLPNMVGFNYIRTPASQLARQIVASGEIGDVIQVTAEHVEDYLHDPSLPASWRTRIATGTEAGALGDVATHIVNACLRLVGPIESLVADLAIVQPMREGPDGPEAVENDDQGQMLLRFANGASGSLSFSRMAAGRKMGYTYRITGTRGAIHFDQEDQNALWLYDASREPARRGFQKLLMGPAHPDYLAFNQGVGHGTGYNEQITIEARDFLQAIATGDALWPTFRDGFEVDRVIAAALVSHRERRWVSL
ncbi:Predicted dehydrogenase [Luteibacter sp. UNC138MFCol5.1]|uniref:Gfo/Idh/MocA family protein n=1 Tax=Luteibacter sp. UNC138MFCol5.1 TaxID=1502774 RepID=UPI0008B57FAA|nr:Gfo/Idh/MocA family oxidoreductase [Luteibacter sp. UNC138MFCol5.1]SEP10764.1 Predicted dehydrogenase [Luteibacter sp. UNC138MFCol5.1]